MNMLKAFAAASKNVVADSPPGVTEVARQLVSGDPLLATPKGAHRLEDRIARDTTTLLATGPDRPTCLEWIAELRECFLILHDHGDFDPAHASLLRTVGADIKRVEDYLADEGARR